MANIDHLAGYVNEPYQKTHVLAAVRKLGHPFVLNEAVRASERSKHIVHMILTRAVRQGILTRTKMSKSYPHGYTPGLQVHRVYLYAFADGE